MNRIHTKLQTVCLDSLPFPSIRSPRFRLWLWLHAKLRFFNGLSSLYYLYTCCLLVLFRKLTTRTRCTYGILGFIFVVVVVVVVGGLEIGENPPIKVLHSEPQMVSLKGLKDIFPGLLRCFEAKEVLSVPLRLVHGQDRARKGIARARIGAAPVLSLARPHQAVSGGPDPDEQGGPGKVFVESGVVIVGSLVVPAGQLAVAVVVVQLFGAGIPPVVALEGVLLGEFRVGPAGGLLQEEVAEGSYGAFVLVVFVCICIFVCIVICL
mmetsp:Transcript_20276/g.56383  ORF Transcript_20276/g.56383 Transcript_20276/m.56383 type:complete len:265 (-) Transcript_20276:1010-1804(-)